MRNAFIMAIFANAIAIVAVRLFDKQGLLAKFGL